MGLMNHSCYRIKIKAVILLYYFIEDLEQKNTETKKIILKNKENFEKYFEKLEDDKDNSDLTEKKNYILYELVRLENDC